jgi:TP901 family phage tail tape measure protein
MLNGIEVSSLYAVLELRDSATQTLRNFDSGMNGVTRRMQNLGSNLTRLGGAITTLTAPLVGLGIAGVKIASDFDSAMAEISARTGTVGDDLERVREFALQMGMDTAFSAQEAADAMLLLLASGQSVEEAMATLPAVLIAAAASGEELGTTAGIVTGILATFGLEAEDAGAVVDILAQASGASRAEIGDLGEAFANVGGVARTFGLDANETAAALAVFSNNGILGAEAGTQLKSVLLNLFRPSADVRDALGELGVNLFNADGSARDFDAILDDLAASLSELPAEDQTRLMQTLGGSYGIVGLSALLASGGIDTMQAEMLKAAPAADVAAARMDTFAGRVDTLKGSVETLAIEALTPFMKNTLQPLVEDLTDTVNGITEWAKANPEAVSTIIQLVGGAALLGTGLIVLGTIINGIAAVVGILSGAVTFLTTGAMAPLLPILLLIGGLFYAYQNNVLGFKDRVEELRTTLGNAWTTINQVVQILMAFGGRVLHEVQRFFDDLSRRFNDFKNNVVQPVIDTLQNLISIVGGGRSLIDTGAFVDRIGERIGQGQNSVMRSGGGGNIYNVSISVPGNVLVSSSVARQAGQDFGEAFMEVVRSRG